MEFASPCLQKMSTFVVQQAESEIGDHFCITESQIFIDNCLNRHVLHDSMYEYLQNVGPLDYNQPPHENVML